MKKKNVFTVLMLGFVFGIAGCSLNNGGGITTPQAVVLFGNLSPDTTKSINVYINGTVALNNIPFSAFTNYGTISTGAMQVKVTPLSSPTAIVDTTFTTEDGKYYSLFAIDSFSKLKVAMVPDVLKTPGADSAMVRFLDFSPNAPAMDLAVTGGERLSAIRTFNDQNFNVGYASFGRVKAGTYNFELRAANTTTVLSSSPNFQLAGGKIYTLVAKGLLGGKGTEKLILGSIRHN